MNYTEFTKVSRNQRINEYIENCAVLNPTPREIGAKICKIFSGMKA